MSQVRKHQRKKPVKEPHLTFGPHPNTQVADFSFEKEVEHLPFKLNLGGHVHLDERTPGQIY